VSELTPWQREVVAAWFPDPSAVLDLIERANALHAEALALRGECEHGAAPARPGHAGTTRVRQGAP
jgi:hypothetical protein